MNREDREDLLGAVVRSAVDLPSSLLDRVCEELIQGGPRAAEGLGRLAGNRRTGAILDALGNDLLELSEQDPGGLALILEAAHRAHEESEGREVVDLVWTGPSTPSVPVRRTEQVLGGLIDGARRDILLVSFATYKVGDLTVALRRAISRGVGVRMVLETEGSGAGKVGYDEVRLIHEDIPGVEVFMWPLSEREKNDRGHHGALHAKCAVADREVALVSSANLTPYALELNMELGILVRGGELPGRIGVHFDELIHRGVLAKVVDD